MKYLQPALLICSFLCVLCTLKSFAAGNIYEPAYNSPYSNPNNSSSIGLEVGVGGIGIGVQIGGNGNGNNGNGNGNGGSNNGVPLEGGTWLLIGAGALLAGYKIFANRKFAGGSL